MAIVPKTDLYGVDVVINDLQNYSDPALLGRWTGLPLAQYQSLPRANKNYKDADKKIPEISDDDFNYSEVLFSDKYAVTSFFLVNDVRNLSDETKLIKHRISIIFQANLKEIYGASTRQDEQFNQEVLDVFAKDNIWINGDIEITEGVDQVYSDLILPAKLKKEINKMDISHFHVVKLSFDVLHKRDCLSRVSLRCPGGVGPVSTNVNGVPTGVDTPAGDTLDINIVDTGGATVPAPLIINTANEKKLKITLPSLVSTSPYTSGQEQSYDTGDEGARFLAGEFASVVFADITDAFTLLLDNEWGHKQNLTGDTGGWMDFATGIFYDKDGVVTTQALAFPNDILRIYSVRRRIYMKRSGSRDWTTSLNTIQGENKGGETGWKLPTREEYEMMSNNNLTNNSSTSYIDARLGFNWPTFTMWSSATPKKTTTNAFRYSSSSDVFSSAVKTQSNGNAYIKVF